MTPAPAPARRKILGLAAAARAVRAAQRRGEQVVFTNGCFDLLHVGHVRSLEHARALGDRLIVAVNSDASVRAQAKGPGRPIVPARQRAEVLAALACVDWVVPFPEPTPLRTIRALRPEVLAKGGDWALDAIVGRREVEGWGGRVVRLREVPGVRTSALVEAIRSAAGCEAPGPLEGRKRSPPAGRRSRR
ncbi:MAG TPA: adenylyltransferase/cytidyltransferase family protein [Myxococcota bacterium]|nr:adenylyltransferase/cytidyltransferase family protein [Myxococcota bacterium]